MYQYKIVAQKQVFLPFYCCTVTVVITVVIGEEDSVSQQPTFKKHAQTFSLKQINVWMQISLYFSVN